MSGVGTNFDSSSLHISFKFCTVFALSTLIIARPLLNPVSRRHRDNIYSSQEDDLLMEAGIKSKRG